MQLKYLATIIAGLFVIIGWNAFLIQRDTKMLNHHKYCEQLKTWHPDCKVE